MFLLLNKKFSFFGFLLFVKIFTHAFKELKKKYNFAVNLY